MHVVPFAVLAGCLALPAFADCTRDVQKLFDKRGAMNAFARPPHSQVATNYNPDGSVLSVLRGRVESPVRTIVQVGEGGDCTLSVEDGYWNGTCWDGPWDGLSGTFPPGRADKLRDTQAAMRASVTEAECFGQVELEGQSLTKYRYRTLIGTVEDSTLAGALYTVFVDEASGQVVRWEADEVVNFWQPEPDGSRTVMQITYDDTIRVTAPGE